VQGCSPPRGPVPDIGQRDSPGPVLAENLIHKAGLADEVPLFLVPVVVGGGKRALPGGVRSDLELLDTQRFASGAVYLRYCLQSA
jgi:dihydrofolate reductase